MEKGGEENEANGTGGMTKERNQCRSSSSLASSPHAPSRNYAPAEPQAALTPKRSNVLLPWAEPANHKISPGDSTARVFSQTREKNTALNPRKTKPARIHLGSTRRGKPRWRLIECFLHHRVAVWVRKHVRHKGTCFGGKVQRRDRYERHEVVQNLVTVPWGSLHVAPNQSSAKG